MKLSETPVTQVIDCFLCYRTASGTGAPGLGPKGVEAVEEPFGPRLGAPVPLAVR